MKSENIFKKFFSVFINSFTRFKKLKMKILWILLIDVAFLLVFYLVFMYGSFTVFDTYNNELGPLAQKVGIANQITSIEDVKLLSENILNSDVVDELGSQTFSLTIKFISKIILTILILIALTSIHGALVWSFLKKSFKKFKKFVSYNSIWVTFFVILFFLISYIAKDEVLQVVLLLILFLFLYFLTIIRIKFDYKEPLFKQLLTQIKFGTKYFIIYMIGFFIFIVLLIISLLLLGMLNKILPIMIVGLIMNIFVLLSVLWMRVFMLNLTENLIKN